MFLRKRVLGLGARSVGLQNVSMEVENGRGK